MIELTLWQPWTTLMAIGAKRIETRSWPAPPSLIGQRVAIHAAKRHPEWGLNLGPAWTVIPAGNGEPLLASKERGKVPTSDWHQLPLGAIVGSGVLSECLPIGECGGYGSDAHLCRFGTQLLHHAHLTSPAPTEFDVTDQLPLGDFTTGRYGWLFTDLATTTERCPRCWAENWTDGIGTTVQEGSVDVANGTLSAWSICSTCYGQGVCDPIPARGRQRVWDWTP